ncbi:NADP-dependent oxidoreductase [Spirillospora sp. CA-294931]|uniref:NADP-dependent oxidoreductase n=1 Tax=Spirillospora sp. CA-294931 TaxID=3240042 RepID=UPI003D8D5E36
MRAILYTAPGNVALAEVPEPQPGAGQVRIRVTAATVNPADVGTVGGYLAAAGLMPGFDDDGAREAFGLGWDVAGTVEAVGTGVTRLKVGDAVIGLNDRLDIDLGTHADLAVLDESAVARAPRTVDAAHAATIPLNGLTALQALDHLALAPGSTLLVTGAAGALGGYAVELAAQRGLRVVATSSAADEDLVRSLGAEHFVPRGEHLGDAVRALVPGGVDGAVDAAALGTQTLEAVRSGGAFAAVLGGDPVPVPLRGIRVTNVWIRADATQLEHLSALVDAGRLTPRVAETIPLSEAAKAYDRQAKGGLRGRLVLVP